MADIKNCVEGTTWRLRAGQAQPVCAVDTVNCMCNQDQTQATINYVIQSFGVEQRTVRNYHATTRMLESNDFIGLNPQGEYESANYQGTNYIDSDGEVIFTGQETSIPEYTTEDQMPGVIDFVF